MIFSSSCNIASHFFAAPGFHQEPHPTLGCTSMMRPHPRALLQHRFFLGNESLTPFSSSLPFPVHKALTKQPPLPQAAVSGLKGLAGCSATVHASQRHAFPLSQGSRRLGRQPCRDLSGCPGAASCSRAGSFILTLLERDGKMQIVSYESSGSETCTWLLGLVATLWGQR